MMAFGLSAEQEQIRETVQKVCAPFDAEYWLKKDREGGFPFEFHKGGFGTRHQ
jgi:acyl-CoA dehydrogenase